MQPIFLYTSAVDVSSNPPISWLQNEKPDIVSDRPPLRLSAIDSYSAVQSPPQCTGNFCPPHVALLANSIASFFAAFFFNCLVYRFIIQIRIIIMHTFRVGSVIIHNPVRRDSLAKISLKTRYSHIQKLFLAFPDTRLLPKDW